MTDALLWACALLFFYTYLLYPLVLLVGGRRRGQPAQAPQPERWPLVSLLIVARDEARALPAKLEDALALDYPEGRLEVLVVSDGSTDGTAAVVRPFEARGVRLLELPVTVGKTRAAWLGAQQARGEVLCFSDATGAWSQGAVRALVQAVSAPGVGCATGRVEYRPGGTAAAAGFAAYQRLVVGQRRAESRRRTVTVVSGSIHAVRREVLREVPPALTYDLALPLLAAERGLRAVYVDEAVSAEDVREGLRSELRARVRIGMRCWRFAAYLLARARHVRLRGYVAQVASLKVLRWLGAPALVVALAATAWGLPDSRVAQAAAVVQAALYGGAAVAGAAKGLGLRVPLLSLLLFFVAVHGAYLVALVRVLAGQRAVGWSPER